MGDELILERGFCDNDRAALESLAWEAFGQKLGWIYFNQESQAEELLRYSIQPETTLIVREVSTKEILGYCSYKAKGTPKNKKVEEIVHRQNNWRTVFLLLLEHNVSSGEFYIENLVVHPKTRGKGIGSTLLKEADTVAKEYNCDHVTLNVIVENDKAKRLYNREGFQDKRFYHLEKKL